MKHRVLGRVILIAALSLIGGLLLRSPTSGEDEGDRVVLEVARKTTALAAILAAAIQVADADQVDLFAKHQLVVEPNPTIDDLFPARRALVEAVESWPEARKKAAFDWLLENPSWASMLHGLAIESFDAGLEPRAWGPTMSAYDPEVFAERAALGSLMRAALEDEAIRAIARSVARQPEPFTSEGIRERRGALVRYLGLEDELPVFHAFHASLMKPGNGVNAVLPDGAVVLVVGASADPSERSLILFHEMAHLPVDRILDAPSARAALASSACAFETVDETYGYTAWRSYFAETLVRSLSYRLEGVGPYDTGFPFERPLTEMLERWEGSGVPFEELVMEMLAALRERAC